MKTFLLLAATSVFAARVETLTSEVHNPYGLVTGPDGALYICEIDRHVISRLDLKTRKLTIVAGTVNQSGYSGDGGPATAAKLFEPYEIRFDKAGHMFFVEMKNHLIRRVDRKTGLISTIAGQPDPGFAGDNGPAAQARFRQPHSIQFDPLGRLVICDIGNNRVRRIDFSTGKIETLAGSGDKKPTPEKANFGPETPLNGPRAIDFDKAGNLYLALREGNQIWRVDAKTNQMTLLAGTGKKGYTGDGGPATQADLNGPKGVSWSPRDGGIYIADTESHTIRRIDGKTGIITTVLGDGKRGNGGDGDPLKCETARPHGVFVDRRGRIFVGDSEAHKVRWVIK